MRCPKCGRISFDHISVCKNCETDLTEIRESLGNIVFSDEEFTWFDQYQDEQLLEADAVDEVYEAEDSDEDADLFSVDISDLIDPSEEDIGTVDIETEDISAISSDDNLQQTLDDVLSNQH